MKGDTTRQMLNAPGGAVFVWCTSDTHYPQRLAQHLGRTDLKIKPRAWLVNGFQGFKGELVIDHAFMHHRPTQAELDGIAYLRSRPKLP